MRARAARSAAHQQAAERVAAWTRERFSLPPQAAVLVAEVNCAVPGCPPLETVVAFWTDDGTRHHFKLFKQVEAVLADDLPYAWLLRSLAAVEGDGCDCC